MTASRYTSMPTSYNSIGYLKMYIFIAYSITTLYCMVLYYEALY